MVGSSSSSTTSERPRGRAGAIVATLLVLVATAAGRLASATGLPDTPDGVRFIASLAHFDLLRFSPHFPGYPLAVAVARAIPVAGGMAWSTLQVIAAVAAAPLAVRLMAPRPPDGAADRPTSETSRFLVLALLLAHPFLALESLRVGTDFLALPFLYGGLLLLSGPPGSARGDSWRGGVLLGLSLGFRPSLFPWLAALLGGRARPAAIGGATVGLLAWWVPSAVVIGARTWITEGQRFVGGHFTRWGGSIGSGGASGEGRIGAIVEHWVLEPLLPGTRTGVGAADLLVSLVLVAGTVLALRGTFRRGERSASRHPLALGFAGYALWIALAQHPEHPRHVIPLVPLVLAGAVGALLRGVEGTRARGLATALVAASVLACTARTVPLLGEYSRSTPPALEAAERLAGDPRFDPRVDRLYVGDDRAFFQSIGPTWSIGTVFPTNGDPRASIARDRDSLPVTPRRTWATSRALDPLVSGQGGTGLPTEAHPLDASAPIVAERSPALGAWGKRIEVWLLDDGEGDSR